MESNTQTSKQKWISDAAYYNSLAPDNKQNVAEKNWLNAEKKFNDLMKKRVKTGLTRICIPD